MHRFRNRFQHTHAYTELEKYHTETRGRRDNFEKKDTETHRKTTYCARFVPSLQNPLLCLIPSAIQLKKASLPSSLNELIDFHNEFAVFQPGILSFKLFKVGLCANLHKLSLELELRVLLKPARQNLLAIMLTDS